ncbi:MAG: hypothetical protein ACOYYS_24525 [Chloroflexota bacterium]
MNKQEAVHYIHQMLEQDHAQSEITRLLAEQLRAPQDVVGKFVTQTAAAYRESKARQAEEATPPWLRELQSSAGAPAQPTLLAEKPPPQTCEVSRTTKLPPWLQENSPADIFRPQTVSPSWQQENRQYVLQQLEMRRPYEIIAEKVATRTGVPPAMARQFVLEVDAMQRVQNERARLEDQQPSAAMAQADIPLQPASIRAKGTAQDPLKDPALVEFVLEGLNHRRKRNDVVMAVCERTSLSWDQAARIVAQVAIQQHSRGAARASEAMMFVALAVTVGGFLLSAVYSLPLLAMLGEQAGMPFSLPFDGGFAIRTPALGVSLSAGGLLLVGIGAAVAYLFYHAAEEHEA